MDYKLNIEKELEKARSDRERILAQRNQIQVRRNETEQQDQELVRQLVRLDGEILGYSKVLDIIGG